MLFKITSCSNIEIKAAKELFYDNKSTEINGHPRKTWQIIHDLTSRKAANLSIRGINLNGTSISESSDLSNAFNDHFSSIGPKLANDIPLSNNNDHSHRKYVNGINNRLEFRPTDSGQVLKLLNKLNKSKGAWTKILLVVNVGSLEKRNQLKYKETRMRSPKTTAKLI